MKHRTLCVTHQFRLFRVSSGPPSGQQRSRPLPRRATDTLSANGPAASHPRSRGSRRRHAQVLWFAVSVEFPCVSVSIRGEAVLKAVLRAVLRAVLKAVPKAALDSSAYHGIGRDAPPTSIANPRCLKVGTTDALQPAECPEHHPLGFRKNLNSVAPHRPDQTVPQTSMSHNTNGPAAHAAGPFVFPSCRR